MDKNITGMLKKEITSSFEKLKTIDTGSKEHASAVEDLAKLYRLAIEESKADQEIRIKKSEIKNSLTRQNAELELKQKELELKDSQYMLERDTKEKEVESTEKELKERKIDRYVKMGLAIAELILPLTFYAYWMKRGLKFEETGTFTSTTFRGLFGHFRPTKN